MMRKISFLIYQIFKQNRLVELPKLVVAFVLNLQEEKKFNIGDKISNLVITYNGNNSLFS